MTLNRVLGYPLQFLFPIGSTAYRFFKPIEDRYTDQYDNEYSYWRYVFYIFNYLGDYANIRAINHSGKQLQGLLTEAVYEFPIEEKRDRSLTYTPPREVIGGFQRHRVINHIVQAGEMLHFYTMGLKDNGPWLFSEAGVKIPGKGVYHRVGILIVRLFRRKPDTNPISGGVPCMEIYKYMKGEGEGLEDYAIQGSSAQVYVLTNSSDTEYIKPRTVDICVADDVEEGAEGLAFAIYLSPKGKLERLPTIPVILHVEELSPGFLDKYLIHIAWHKLLHHIEKEGKEKASLAEFEEVYNRLRENIRGRLHYISDMFRESLAKGSGLVEILSELDPCVFIWDKESVRRLEANLSILKGESSKYYELGVSIPKALLKPNIDHFKKLREKLYGEYVLL